MNELFSDMRLDKDARAPLYQQLYEKLKKLIADGILLPDVRLPSIRQLAKILGVNRVTVVSAFKQLENEGYVYCRGGSGTYTANVLPLDSEVPEPGSDGPEPGTGMIKDNMINDELYQLDDIPYISNNHMNLDEKVINFASATPSPDLFPVEDFKAALNEVLVRDKGNAFGYQDSQGFYPIRESMSGLLQKHQINGSAENIQIISGAQQGIDIISKAFLKQGDYVITESPTYTGAIAVFKSRGAQIADVEITEGGPDLNILEYNFKKYKPRLIYTIPSFQNPTGYSWPPHKRLELLKLADRYNSLIIEDDYVSGLDFEGMGFIPLKALDRNNRVILIKSFSKIFMPGLRLGFMMVPPDVKVNILKAKHTTDISTSGLIQRAFDLYIRKGYWDKHFMFMYNIYKERYIAIIESLDKYLPSSSTFSKPGGGLNIWLKLPYGFPVNSLAKSASANNIVFSPGRIFYSSNFIQKYNNIRLSFASVDTCQIESGIKKLCDLINLY